MSLPPKPVPPVFSPTHVSDSGAGHALPWPGVSAASADAAPQIDVQRNTVHWGGQVWRIRHSLGGLFLHALWAAHRRGELLRRADFEAACMAQGVRTLPNRKSMQRLLAATELVLSQWPAAHRPRLRTQPRGYTVGPWGLSVPVGSCWQSQADDARPELPNLGDDLDTLADVALALMQADVDLHKTHRYHDAEKRLRALLTCTPTASTDPNAQGWPHLPLLLTPDMVALVAMRWIQAMRRLGQLADEQVGALMAWLHAHLDDLTPAWAQMVNTQLTLLQARTAYDALPNKAAQTIAFEAMRQQANATPNAQALTEYCNLKALSLRRLWQQTPPQSTEHGRLIERSRRHAIGAYFWACAGQDAYWQQATAINLAYLLQCLWDERIEQNDPASPNTRNTLSAALRWYSLGDDWVRRFDLLHDSAWDFLMFALLYKRALAQDPQWIEQHHASWPAEADPRQWAFYRHALALADEYGTVRQQIQAADLAVWFLKTHTESARLQSQYRKQRDALMRAHPLEAEELVRDGFGGE